MSEPTLHEIRDFAVDAAREAGKITLEYFQTAIDIEKKADETPVTIADRSSEKKLREMIRERFPEDAILGEEFEDRAGTSDRRWILDPIDGTKSFVHGVPLYGVMIGVEIAEVPAVGVVNLPALDEMVSAANGLGCDWNGRTAQVSAVTAIRDALILCTNFENLSKHGKQDAFLRLRESGQMVRGWGDCYGHILVATGRAEVMLDPVLEVWDAAALLPILQEAGGTFTDWKGNATIRGKEGVSTNGKLFGEVVDRLSG